MKLCFVCTKGIRCGIAVYQLYLAKSLKKLGHDVRVIDIYRPINEIEQEVREFRPDVLHLQYEPAFGMIETFLGLGKMARRTVVTCHRPMMEHMPLFLKNFSGMVVHRDVPVQFHGPHLIKMPMAAPVFDKVDKQDARKAAGFPADARIIATFGFISSYKGLDQVLACLIPGMKTRPDVYAAFMTSEHFMNPTSGETMERRMARIAKEGGISDRFFHTTKFLSDEEMNRYLQAADLGLIWCGQNTGGNSAAALQFITARIPSVVTESDHFHTLPNDACVRTPFDIGKFCDGVFATLDNPGLLKSLAEGAEKAYSTINYHEVGKRYVAFYERFQAGD